MENHVTNDVMYVTGFQELCKEDQICLIRHGIFEVILTWFTPLLQDDGMFTLDMHTKIAR